MAKEFPLFNDKIAENLKKSSRDCYKNGVELLEEANILYDHERYARAVSLAILAEEEFAKGIVLMDCSSHRRWDSIIYHALKKHESKHVIASAMAKVIDVIRRKNSLINSSLFPRPLEPKDLKKNGILNEGILIEEKKELKRKKKDKRKQDAQFVAIDKNGRTSKQPKVLFTKRDAQIHIDTAVRTRAALELIDGKRTLDDQLFCTDYFVNSFYSNHLVAFHTSGIAILMDESTLIDKNKRLTQEDVNFYKNNFNNFFNPDILNNEQRKTLAKLYKAYDALNQIRQEMQELGLKDTTYLEEVETLIADYAHE